MAGHWYDFSRSNDPTSTEGYRVFHQNKSELTEGDVLCFWTANPFGLVQMYKTDILELHKKGIIVVAQPTMNFYGNIEPGIKPEFLDLGPLVDLLGNDHVRVRFDPIIPGYTTPKHFKQCVNQVVKYGIEQVTINFLADTYPKALARIGVKKAVWDDKKKMEVINNLLEIVDGRFRIAMCAESSKFVNPLCNIYPARCADPEWVTPFGYVVGEGHNSRKGCGCFYTKNWRFNSKCPHGCVYCFSNMN